MKIQLGVLVAFLCGLATIGTGIVSQSEHSGYSQAAQVYDTSGTSYVCPSQVMTWTVNGNTCEGSVSSMLGGSNAYAADTMSPTTGSAQYTCTSAGWSDPTNESCYTMPSTYSCPSQTTEWTVEGNSCEGVLPSTAPGTSIVVPDSVTPVTGSATYTCRTDGTWSSPNNQICYSQPSSYSCPGQVMTWTVNGNTCEGSVSSMLGGSNAYAADTMSPTTGSAQYTCRSDGTWSTTPTGQSCTTTSSSSTVTTTTTTTTTYTYPACSLARVSGEYRIDFTEGGKRTGSDLLLIANKGESDAKHILSKSIPAGAYDIKVQTMWDSSLTEFTGAGSDYQQQWLVEFVLTDASVQRTKPTRDLTSSDLNQKDLLATGFSIPVAVSKVVAKHYAYSTNRANPLIPVCAVLTPVQATTTATTTAFTFSTTTEILHGRCDTSASYKCISGNVGNKGETTTHYIWDCISSTGGTTAKGCTFAKTTSAPLQGKCSGTKNACISGVFTDINDTSTEYRWMCKGDHGGVDASCVLTKPTLEYEVQNDTSVTEGSRTGTDSDSDGEGEKETVSDVVYISAGDIGISGDDVTTTLPKEILEVRREIIQQTETTPFLALRDASSAQRETLVRTWMEEKSMGSTSEESTATKTQRILTRLSRELPPEEASPEGEASDDVSDVVSNRSGLASINDKDGDGISDYDEEHIYGTDPEDPFTADSVLSDGERVILGMDPLTDTIEPVIVESPKLRSRTTDTTLYSIESIELVQETREDVENMPETQGIRVRGRAQPLAFVTLYVYSTPIIVTVQADASGRFDYILDTTLEDGSHEVYVASVNNSGKILAQSSPIPFIKTAQAIEYTPATVSGADPVDSATQLMLTLTLLAVLLIAVMVIVWIGMHHAQSEEPGAGTLHEDNQV